VKRFQAINSDGTRHTLQFIEWRGGLAYLVTDGAASYLADPKTGKVEGTESMTGTVLQLVPNALKRLREVYRDSDQELDPYLALSEGDLRDSLKMLARVFQGFAIQCERAIDHPHMSHVDRAMFLRDLSRCVSAYEERK